MKPLSLLASLFLIFCLSACNEVSAQNGILPKGSSNLNAKVDSLSAALKKVSDEFDILKIGLEKRGVSMDQIKAEIEMENKVWDLPEGTSPVAGNTKNPKITIVEFSEFQCPYCSRIAPVIQELVKKYPNDIKLVFKHFPLSFHQNAPAAAAASMAAQKQGKFWEFRYALAPHFNELTPETFIKVAQEVGLNMEQFKKDMVLDADKQKRIDEDLQLGVQVGVQGTPNFYINGKRQDRFSPQLVEEMIKNAK
ncbi:MAG: thioredoxin domain-containing protein [Fibrobacter sp.]|jgi:protein-disulfide isomerase|nr:thioredoxin domain-containing protein [Fibrobacter sp.]